jgi:hypothetical protein
MRLRATTADDELLQSLIGSRPFAARTTVLLYMSEMMPESVRGWLLGRLRTAVIQPQFSPQVYRPGDMRADHWMAIYSLNLMLLVLACGSPLRAGELWTETRDPAYWMRSTAQAWRSAVPSGMFMDVMAVVDVERTWTGNRRDISTRLDLSGAVHLPKLDPMWSRGLRPGSVTGRVGAHLPYATHLSEAQRLMALTNNLSDDLFWHAILPLFERDALAFDSFHVHGPDDIESPAHSLLRLWTTSLTGDDESLKVAYQRAWAALFEPGGMMHPSDFCTVLLLRSMARDAGRLPPEFIAGHLHEVVEDATMAGAIQEAFDECVSGLPESLRQALRARMS